MPLIKKSMLKIRFNKKQREWSKTNAGFFPVTLKAPFLTLIQIILNFKCYMKDWHVNNSKKKYNLCNTKRASNKKSRSWQWVKWSRHPRLVLTQGKWLLLWSFPENNKNACSLHLLLGLVIIPWLFVFVYL